MATSAALNGRVAVVTGCTRGFGRVLISDMARAGAHVVVSSPFDTAPLDTSLPDAATADPVVTEPVTALECPPEAGTEGVSQSFTTAPPFCLDPAATYTAVVSTSIGWPCSTKLRAFRNPT